MHDKVIEILDSMAAPGGGARNSSIANIDPLTTSQVLVLSRNVPELKKMLGNRYEKSIDYLIQTQSVDGHWERPDDSWHSSITAWALTALVDAPSSCLENSKAGFRWLSVRELSDGGVSESEKLEEPNTYSTGCTIRALFSSNLPSQRYQHHVRWLLNKQTPEGGFTDSCVIQNAAEPSITAYVWHALQGLATSESVNICKGIGRFIENCQRPSGAWTTWFDDTDTVEGTAACLRVLISHNNIYETSIRRGWNYLQGVDLNNQEWWTMVSLGYLLSHMPKTS